MNTPSTLWIDVTMLINWSGHLTGIQRVEYNLAKRFALQPNVKFCVFRKEQRALTEFDFKHIAYKMEMLQHQPGAATAEIDEGSAVPLQKRILAKAKRLAAQVLPDESKQFLRRQYHRLQNENPAAPVDPPIVFSKDDTLLILSGDWSDAIFATMVAEIRDDSRCRVVQIIYDMLPAFYPGYFVPGMPDQFSTYMRQLLANCDGVLAISESTKRDVQRFMTQHKINTVPIEVFRLGDDFVQQEAIKPAINVKKNNFILCVCTVEARKNHAMLYYAAREAAGRGEKLPPFVVVGKKGWLIDDLFYLIKNDPVISKQFIFINSTDQELAWLYQNCSFTVFPSFYEGWGLPVAESLFYGKYCLSSGASSMPEIAGDLIEYFSPNDPMDLLKRIEHYTQNPSLLKDKEKKIQNTYKATSWDASFAQASQFVARFLS